MKTKLVAIVNHYVKLLEDIESDPSVTVEKKSEIKTMLLEKADKEILDYLSRPLLKEIK
jgi:hypothetical protein